MTLAFGEVVPALQNKTVDCAITGTLSGNVGEVERGDDAPAGDAAVVGPDRLRRQRQDLGGLRPALRNLIDGEIKALEKAVWDAADNFTQQGYECNAGTDKCTLGTKGKMTVVQPSAADRELLKKALAEVTMPKWAERCSAACVAEFNATVGKITGVTAKK